MHDRARRGTAERPAARAGGAAGRGGRGPRAGAGPLAGQEGPAAGLLRADAGAARGGPGGQVHAGHRARRRAPGPRRRRAGQRRGGPGPARGPRPLPGVVRRGRWPAGASTWRGGRRPTRWSDHYPYWPGSLALLAAVEAPLRAARPRRRPARALPAGLLRAGAVAGPLEPARARAPGGGPGRLPQPAAAPLPVAGGQRHPAGGRDGRGRGRPDQPPGRRWPGSPSGPPWRSSC